MSSRLLIRFVQIVGILIAAFLVWLLLISEDLRFFIPRYFKVAGLPFSSRSYLVVFQNNNELRPTGGFISAYGVLKFKNAVLTGLEIKDVYALEENTEFIEPPYPMKELLNSPYYKGYAFRDANWSPDFAVASEELISFYQRHFPQERIDGVIAVNFSILESLLEILKTVQVGDLVFRRENLFSLLEHSVTDIDKHNLQDLQERKDVLRVLFKKIIRQVVYNVPYYHNFFLLLEQGLKEKNILVYFKNVSLEREINLRHFGGVLPKPGQRDFLAVSEANLGGMKSNRYILREVDYQVEIKDSAGQVGKYGAEGKLTLRFSHRGDYNEPLSYTFKGYVRTLLPLGVKFLETPVGTHLQEELGYQSVGNIINLEPQQTKELVYRFVLSPEIFSRPNFYRLYLVKQPGTALDFYRVTVRTPIDFLISSQDFVTRENVAVFQKILDKDQILDLSWTEDRFAPLIGFQEFTALNTLELHFNEPVLQETCADLRNYQVEDLDLKNASHDTVRITEVNCEDRKAVLKLEGITRQAKESYQLTLRDIADLQGNVIAPNPRVITVVQK